MTRERIFHPASVRWFIKLATIGALTVALLVGLLLIQGVRGERARLQDAAEREIAASWGPAQVLVGPVLRVPVVTTEEVPLRWQDEAGKWSTRLESQSVRRAAWLMPERLEARVELQPEIRARGLYEAVVYAATAELEFVFAATERDFAACDEVRWEEAVLVLAVSDGRSLREIPEVELGERSLKVTPGAALTGWKDSLVAGLELGGGGAPSELRGRARLWLQGMDAFHLASVAQSQSFVVEGSWPHPSFQGPPLPSRREVTAEGFVAEWRTTEFARAWPKLAIDTAEKRLGPEGLRGTLPGVALVQLVDPYWMVGRALKYGILFIVAVFTVFLLVEVRGGIRVHPVQYLLVGAALVLFFLAFLALAEVVGATAGYVMAALGATALIAGYTRTILGAGRRAAMMAGGLGATYGYLFFVLWSESYALLSGTVALFALLGAVMWATRRIDWYRLPGGAGPAAGERAARGNDFDPPGIPAPADPSENMGS
jgi:inner membrane protein